MRPASEGCCSIPVWGVRNPGGPIERTRTATAPHRAARDAESDRHRLFVARVGDVEKDDSSFGPAGVCVKLVEAADHQHFRLHAAGRGSDAVADAEHHQRLANRLDDVGALVAANPARNHDLLGMHVFQAVALHLGHRPLDGALELYRTGETMTNGVRELRETPPGKVSFMASPMRRAAGSR